MTLDCNSDRNQLQTESLSVCEGVDVPAKPWHPEGVTVDADEIGQRIKQALKARGWTAAELIRRTGIPQSSISHTINGTRTERPSIPNLVRISEVLQVTLDWLLLGHGPTSGTPQTPYERACEAFVLLATDPAKARQFVASQANLFSQHTDRLTAEDHLGFLRVSYPRWVAGTEDELPPGTKFRAPRELHEINPRPKRAAKK